MAEAGHRLGGELAWHAPPRKQRLRGCSVQDYAERVPDPEYPSHWERRRVYWDDSPKCRWRQLHPSEALAWEAAGLVGVEERVAAVVLRPGICAAVCRSATAFRIRCRRCRIAADQTARLGRC